MMSDYLTTPELAKHLRGVLGQRFPAQKFSVRSKSYSGGSSITIHWTDGPTRGAVEAAVNPFEGAGFDASQDLQYSKNVTVNGKKVLTSFIFCERALSAGALAKVVAAVGTHYGIPETEWPGVVAGSEGYGAYLDQSADRTSPIGNAQNERHWSWAEMVRRAAENRQEVAA